MLTVHNLTQLVDVPNHKHGHILDWVVVRREGRCLSFESELDYTTAVFLTIRL